MEHEDRVSEIPQSRCGEHTVGVLRNGRRLKIDNVASGRDMGATCDHITTNIPPMPAEACAVDFFHTSEVLRLEDSSGAGMILAVSLALPATSAEPIRIDGATEQTDKESFARMVEAAGAEKARELQVAMLLIALDGVAGAKEMFARPSFKVHQLRSLKIASMA